VAAFQNPEFHRAQAMRLPTYGNPKIDVLPQNISRHSWAAHLARQTLH
jgi:hypothetical protein